MKIKFMGAAGTVTGSSYVLTSGSGQSLLIDLGMFQGTSDIEQLNYRDFAYDCSTLVGAVLTHAHLDHCGRLPILLKKGFTESVYMTSATADLTELSLLDTAKIAKEDGKPILFDKELAIEMTTKFKRVYYRTPTQIGDFIVTMRDAGHILGAAIVEIEDIKATSDIHKIVFSGDLGNSPDDLLHEIEMIENADAVVMESTYGDRLHPTSDPMVALAQEINEVEAVGGTLLIPAFSLHRTQELMHMIKHLKEKGAVRKDTPVFMDSPMGNEATTIYTRYQAEFNDHIQKEFEGSGPFDFPGLTMIRKKSGHKLIDVELGAKVIIAGSGMMSGGRIVGHAAKYLQIPSTRLFIVGYQGIETLGRELLEGAKVVSIEGKKVSVKAMVTDTQSMSSHADQGQLIKWLKPIKGAKKVFLTHGEDGPRQALAEKIKTDLGISDIVLPTLHEEVML